VKTRSGIEKLKIELSCSGMLTNDSLEMANEPRDLKVSIKISSKMEKSV
jgi:hypothetical protein